MTGIEGVVPKYLQIAAHLRELIERGELAAGAEVPSERELAARWKVARPTAAKALNTLRQQGIVRSRRGSGTYVAEQSALLRESAPRYESSPPGLHSVRVLRAEVVEGPREVTAALGLPASSAVVVRKLLSEGNSGAARLVTCWYPGEFASAATLLLEPEPVPGDGSRYPEAVLGRGVAIVRESVGARLATEDERRHLALAPPAAVLVVHRIGLDAHGVALVYRESVHPPGRSTLHREYFTSSTAVFRR
ncbi:GntR family transcriptional regulator [Nocardia beijingensis]|uniref:GntR family transcriptional regulator n=1 Tax=Nocardia beijingensis TaxID=95162 RepID=UPI001893F0BE|nr:GntR family transcriptional regulator [Nocardia beijingensis]MBF6464510.1 GntR family transcriptional regulator [Nocardia beijingensis]